MALLNPGKVGIYAEPQGDRIKLNSTPKAILEGLDSIGFRWYYTYANATDWDLNKGFDNRGTLTDPGYTPQNIVQYGAIWDPTPQYQNITQMNLAQSLGKPIVTYDEPWNQGTGFWPEQPISVASALDAWPALMALGNELWSPSVSYNLYTDSNAWLADFMAGVASRGYRVDAICVHFYPPKYTSSTISEFRNYLEAMHATYPSYPLIVSEWSIADFGYGTGGTPEENADFAEAACIMMDGLDYVKAHAWFAATEGTGFFWYNTAVINADGSRTVVGDAFKSMLAGAVVTPPVPPSIPSGPSLSRYMNGLNLIQNPDLGTVISAATGTLPTYSAVLNARNINRRTV